MSTWPRPDKQYKCNNCNMIVAVPGGLESKPDPKLGGPCPKHSDGKHNWITHR